MLVEYYIPQALSPGRLDRFLAGGWFRSGGMLYKSHLLCIDGDIHSLIHIRTRLHDYKFTKGQRKILSRNKRRFRIEIGDAYVDEQRERLYQNHKHRFKGFIMDTLEGYLYSDLMGDVFNTQEVSVYDGDRLVAVSYFDEGQSSMASIMGLHDAEYSKHSLGYFTMLLEVEHGLKTEKKYYYPGYILDRNPGFDYKLRIGNMQFYNGNHRWIPIEKRFEESLPGQVFQQKTEELGLALEKVGLPYVCYIYPLFSIGYLNVIGDELLKSPIFISCEPDGNASQGLLITYYHIEDRYYTVSQVRLAYGYPDFTSMASSEDEYLANHRYYMDLLVLEQKLFSHISAEEVASFISKHKGA